jgi:hypothetical protein
MGMTPSLVRNIVQAIRRHRLAAYYAGALALTWAAWGTPRARADRGPSGRLAESMRRGCWGRRWPRCSSPRWRTGLDGLAQIGRSLVRWRFGPGAWLMVASPLLLFAATALVTAALGRPAGVGPARPP